MAKELKINKFKNAFGIKELKINNESKPILCNNIIYAPNGVFKTSFARTFYNFSHNKDVEERIKHKPFQYDIEYGTNKIEDVREQILVFSKEIMNEYILSENMSGEINSLAIIPELHEKMMIILEEIKNKYDEIINILKLEGIPENKFANILQINDINHQHNVITAFKHILCHAEFIDGDNSISNELLFSSSYDKMDNDEFRNSIKQYHEFIMDLASNTFFDEKFTVFTARDLLKVLKSSDFLNEKRNISIDGVNYDNYNDIERLIESKIQKLLSTKEAVEKAKAVQKCIGKKSRTDKELSKLISSDIKAVELMKYPRFAIKGSQLRKKYGDLLLEDISNFLDEVNRKLDNLEIEAQKSRSNFDRAIEIFNKRFMPKFDIVIENRNILALGVERVYPSINFIHNSEKDIKLDEETIYKILSLGEKNALDILKFIVLYDKIKNNSPLIILDDVIETFDYGNRYAFVQYVKDIINEGANVIILTSNYEFFKNLSSRVYQIKYLGAHEIEGKVEIQKYKQLKSEPKDISTIKSLEDLYYMMPFAREIATYKNKENSFLKYFHYKKGTVNLNNNSLLSLCKKELNVNSTIPEDKKKMNYIDSLFKICDSIASDKNSFKPFDLNKKIILSIGIRMKFEKLMVEDNGYSCLNGITKDQTTTLIKNNKYLMNNEFCDVCDRIIICIPEFIHLNAFMYEPLVDIMPDTLIELYHEISKYCERIKDWKKNIFQPN